VTKAADNRVKVSSIDQKEKKLQQLRQSLRKEIATVEKKIGAEV
jgi:hypothetical protein